MLCNDAPEPKYNIVLSSDIPREELRERAIVALSHCRAVEAKDREQFQRVTKDLDPGDDLVIYQILKLVEID